MSQYDAPPGWAAKMRSMGYKFLTGATGAFGTTANIIIREEEGTRIVFKTRYKQPLSLRCCDFDDKQMEVIEDLVKLGVLYHP